ncbi:MAG: hypothetical protein ACRC35_01385 [Angustibacter sp.]
MTVEQAQHDEARDAAVQREVWRKKTAEEVFAGVESYDVANPRVIDGVTDEEWDAFANALAE